MRKEKLILRIYRITKQQDSFIKKESKRLKVAEASYIRYLITNDMARNIRIKN